MKEEKVLFQSPANAEAVQIKRERMERFGWILENSEYDQDRNLTRLFYARDLSIPENQQKKELEEEAEKVSPCSSARYTMRSYTVSASVKPPSPRLTL